MESHTLDRGGHTLLGGGHLANPKAVTGVSPTTSVDLSTPVIQSFPETAAGLAALLGDPTALASHIFPLQEISGNLLDVVGAGALVPSGGLRGQSAPGLWNGANMTSRKAFETQATTDLATNTGDTTLFDQTTGSFAMIGVARCHPEAGNGPLVGKRNSTAGFDVRPTGTAGMVFSLEDTGATTKQITESGNSVKTRESFCFAAVVNRTTNLMWLITPNGATSLDISGLGSLTNTNAFGLGQQNGHLAGAGMSQMLYLACFEGAAAEAIDQAALNAFWKHATSPVNGATFSRASVMSLPVAAGAVAHFGIDQVPIGYKSSLVNARKLALWAPATPTNLITWSEDFTNAAWTKTTMSVAGDNANAPDGFRIASKLTAGAANDQIKQTFTTLALTKYTLSVWIKEVTPGATGRVVFYDEVGASELASQAFTADDTWGQRIEVTATTGAAQISSSIRIEIDNNTEEILAWGAQAELGDGAGAYIWTTTTARALTTQDYKLTDVVPIRLGRVEAQAMLATDVNTGQILLSTESTTDWRVLWHGAGRSTRFYYYNGSGVSWTNIIGSVVSIGTSRKYVGRWDIDDASNFPEDPDRSASGHLDGTIQGTPAINSSTLSEELRDLKIGLNYNNTGGFNGWIESINIYDDVGAEPT